MLSLRRRQYNFLWSGRLRHIPAVMIANLGLSSLTLFLSAWYGIQLTNAALDAGQAKYHGAHRWSDA